jgi:hypothetical protein
VTVPWGELALNTLALLAYPGAAATLAFGLTAEGLAGRVLGPSRRLLPGLRSWPRGTALPPLAAAAALLTLLSSTQLAAPFNPLAATQRNLLVATVALASAAWLTWAWGWSRGSGDARLSLVAQACWLVALLAPALVSQTLRPQVLGAVVLPAQLALKVVAGTLFLLCLPVLLQLLPQAAPQGTPGAVALDPSGEQAGFAAVRVLLWMPQCGLFASVFFPGGEDALGLLRFLVSTLAAAAMAIALALVVTRWRPAWAPVLYFRLVPPLVALALLLAVAVAVYTEAL